ncbi:MAG: glycosyltransferase family 2 protein [Thermoleophilaceae bacterium]|nr:glycosyltransferase family 2 protein [Thermoleophilaceae bacterium]
MTELSVVIPVYGCEACLRELHRRLRAATATIEGKVEIVFVDDRSADGAWETLREIARSDAGVRAVRLSRNFGQHAAITAGLEAATGRWAVVMDCDLQDPPEAVPRLYEKAREGYDVVLSRRTHRRQHWLRRASARVYHHSRNVLVKGDMYVNYTNMSIISRKVIDAFLVLRDRDRQYLLIVQWLGFHRAEIEVEPLERYAGRSSYRVSALLKVAVDGMFFQSTVLLRWIVYAGFVLAAGGVALFLYAVAVLLLGRELPDWTALPMAALLLSGFIIISTGVSGLYVGKIFDQVKGRPLYVVDTEITGGSEHPPDHEVPSSAEPEAVAHPSATPVRLS